MDYETYLDIRQYSSDGTFHFNLRVTDVMNMDYEHQTRTQRITFEVLTNF